MLVIKDKAYVMSSDNLLAELYTFLLRGGNHLLRCGVESKSIDSRTDSLEL